MTVRPARPPEPELEPEREVDLARWRAALLVRWWLVAAGLVAGAIVGGVYSLGGAEVYKARALISLGQPFSPTGSAPVASYATNPRAVGEIVRAEWAIKRAARAAGIGPGALRGHVSTGTVGTTTGPAATRGAPLISLTVELHRPKHAEDAANELAKLVVDRTTAAYVGTKIATFKRSLQSIQDQLDALAPLVKSLTAAANNRSVDVFERLDLATSLNNAELRRGQLLDLQTTTQQQLALAENVESAKVIEPASAVKSTARSRRNSILVGALIGLILGAVAAIVADSRAPRARPA